MRLVGLLVVLGGILLILYYLSSDLTTMEGGGRATNIEAAGAAGRAVDSLKLDQETTKKSIEEIYK